MAKMTANMTVEMSDEVLGKIAESLGLGKAKSPQKLVMEVKDIGGKIVIKAEPTEEAVAEGGAKLDSD
ncbi:MAG: hypothetical protein GSR82_00160 [Desulfurococcales archaeon]|nr:hypothetical protein [Desulfurococcales archaeon]MEB3799388.1 hypothetical protein [Desulfurococcales archaeon]MEB3846088.1 hypothetical protein [Desulfurococcales archaeon]